MDDQEPGLDAGKSYVIQPQTLASFCITTVIFPERQLQRLSDFRTLLTFGLPYN